MNSPDATAAPSQAIDVAKSVELTGQRLAERRPGPSRCTRTTGVATERQHPAAHGVTLS